MRRSLSSGIGPVFLGFCLFVLTALAAFAGVSVAQNSRGGVDDVLVYERQGWIWTCDGEG